DLPAGEQEAVRAHVERCAQCGRALAGLADERAALLARTPPAALTATLERRRLAERRRRLAWLSGSLGALAAAAVLVLVVRTPAPPLGVKGGGLSVYAKRGQQVRL